MTHARAQHRMSEWLTVCGLSAVVGVCAGLASAVFMVALQAATTYRLAHESVMYGLPVAGLALGFAFDRWGARFKAGTNLIIDTTLLGGTQLPRRMAPMVLVGTVWSHLWGASVGREGTAVQMGSSLADTVAHLFKVSPRARRLLLLSGVAGGFGSVFGAPLAGALFAMEFTVTGTLQFDAIVPVVIASVIGWQTALAVGVHHVEYPSVAHVAVSGALILKLALVAVACGVTARLFLEALHRVKAWGERWVPNRMIRTAIGGALLVVVWRTSGEAKVFGLSTELLLSAFDAATPIGAQVPMLKIGVTVISVGLGFIGGEVVPLFVTGATLGHVLAQWLGLPVPLTVALSLVTVFAAASNAPLALSVLAAELFGASLWPLALLTCGLAFVTVGHRSLYGSQRFARLKTGRRLEKPLVAHESKHWW